MEHHTIVIDRLLLYPIMLQGHHVPANYAPYGYNSFKLLICSQAAFPNILQCKHNSQKAWFMLRWSFFKSFTHTHTHFWAAWYLLTSSFQKYYFFEDKLIVTTTKGSEILSGLLFLQLHQHIHWKLLKKMRSSISATTHKAEV